MHTVATEPQEHTPLYQVPPENRITPRTAKGYDVCKRCFDACVALAALLVLLVPMVLIVALIRLTSPGAAIYRQERLGLHGKPFVLLKFRSMRLDAEKHGPQWARPDDERCTKIGRILRKTRLDELPQLWNILKGDMSFVGPRPERAHFYREFEPDIPDFSKRLCVLPGLTGLAQVNGGYELEPAEKLAYDLEYIQTRSFWLDMKCIFKTVRLVFTHEGAR